MCLSVSVGYLFRYIKRELTSIYNFKVMKKKCDSVHQCKRARKKITGEGNGQTAMLSEQQQHALVGLFGASKQFVGVQRKSYCSHKISVSDVQ